MTIIVYQNFVRDARKRQWPHLSDACVALVMAAGSASRLAPSDFIRRIEIPVYLCGVPCGLTARVGAKSIENGDLQTSIQESLSDVSGPILLCGRRIDGVNGSLGKMLSARLSASVESDPHAFEDEARELRIDIDAGDGLGVSMLDRATKNGMSAAVAAAAADGAPLFSAQFALGRVSVVSTDARDRADRPAAASAAAKDGERRAVDAMPSASFKVELSLPAARDPSQQQRPRSPPLRDRAKQPPDAGAAPVPQVSAAAARDAPAPIPALAAAVVAAVVAPIAAATQVAAAAVVPAIEIAASIPAAAAAALASAAAASPPDAPVPSAAAEPVAQKDALAATVATSLAAMTVPLVAPIAVAEAVARAALAPGKDSRADSKRADSAVPTEQRGKKSTCEHLVTIFRRNLDNALDGPSLGMVYLSCLLDLVRKTKGSQSIDAAARNSVVLKVCADALGIGPLAYPENPAPATDDEFCARFLEAANASFHRVYQRGPQTLPRGKTAAAAGPASRAKLAPRGSSDVAMTKEEIAAEANAVRSFVSAYVS